LYFFNLTNQQRNNTMTVNPSSTSHPLGNQPPVAPNTPGGVQVGVPHVEAAPTGGQSLSATPPGGARHVTGQAVQPTLSNAEQLEQVRQEMNNAGLPLDELNALNKRACDIIFNEASQNPNNAVCLFTSLNYGAQMSIRWYAMRNNPYNDPNNGHFLRYLLDNPPIEPEEHRQMRHG
jgi:hypothetical protein